jgi:hypothetical protein
MNRINFPLKPQRREGAEQIGSHGGKSIGGTKKSNTFGIYDWEKGTFLNIIKHRAPVFAHAMAKFQVLGLEPK